MRPLSGGPRMDVGSTTSPTLASVVCKISLPAVTLTPCATEPTPSVISKEGFWPTPPRKDPSSLPKPHPPPLSSQASGRGAAPPQKAHGVVGGAAAPLAT